MVPLDDRDYAGLTPKQLASLVPADAEWPMSRLTTSTSCSGAVMVCASAMTSEDSFGETRRATTGALVEMEINLSLANMDWEDFAGDEDTGLIEPISVEEFVAVLLAGFTGLRWGELVGLKTEFARTGAVRVEWQLYELDTGELTRCPPKDDSYRTIDTPPWLTRLVADHIARARPTPCPCHGRTYVFCGLGAANGATGRPGVRLADVDRRAGVSTGTVSNVLNGSATVAEGTRARVDAAIADLGYVRGTGLAAPAAHWRRTGFATWLFQPAVTGWYPKKSPQPARPVPFLAEPWPEVPVRGRGAHGRADACWLPIAPGLTPHGLRHSHRTLIKELGTPGCWPTSGLGTRTPQYSGATRT